MAPRVEIPHTQGLTSETFKQPPLDCTLAIHEIYEWHAVHSPKHPLFVYEDKPGSTRTITWSEAVRGIHRITRFIRRAVGPELESRKDGKAPVVSILATLDSITYFCFTVAAFRTGCTLFPLSPRNSASAIKHLLSATGSKHLFVSPDLANQNLAAEALRMDTDGIRVKVLHTPCFEDAFPENDSAFVPEPATPVSIDDAAIVYHSSGTTSFPKPIYTKHSAIIRFGLIGTYGTVDFAGQVFGCHAVPLFHGMGAFEVTMAASCGIVIGVFKPRSPPIVPNPVNTLQGYRATKTDYVFITPTFLETWATESESVRKLAEAKAILYGGGPLSKEAGDHLVSNGCNLYSSYASTEAMHISNVISEPLGKDWEYFEISPARMFRLEEYSEDQYHLILLASDIYRPNVINLRNEKGDAYATNDLVAIHPTRKNLVKVVGRVDDQIMHSTGEKTNPGPLERMLMRDPHVSDAVMFGRKRFFCGILVNPTPELSFDPADKEKLSAFRGLIWPTIEGINAYAPSHSRIFKEMIVVSSPSKPFLYTAKGTLKRHAILADYEQEINDAYDAVDNSSQTDVAIPAGQGVPEFKEFVRNVLDKIMKVDLKIVNDDKDLFELGLDSLQATFVRNTIINAVRGSYPEVARMIPQNFVYEHPTIDSLAFYLSAIVFQKHENGNDVGVDDAKAKRIELMELVKKYTGHAPALCESPIERDRSGFVVLLTGSTGSLGSNMLARLILNDEVIAVYAMSRPTSDNLDAKTRHARTFEKEGLSLSLLNSEKVRFIIGDASQRDLGISADLFSELQANVSHVIHNAWRVNFNVSVASFESNIRSVQNFAYFCLSSCQKRLPRLIFISSIGVFRRYSGPFPAPEFLLDKPDSAIGTGYSESKWVAERILQVISRETPLEAVIVRCGQLTGGRSGAWNDHEWFPSLVKSSIKLRRFPLVDGRISWISAFDAAGAVIDCLEAKADVLHVVHPRPASWNGLWASFSEFISTPVTGVPYDDWLDMLEREMAELGTEPAIIEKAFREIPALRLMDFFRSARGNASSAELEPLGIAKLASHEAQATSLALRCAHTLGVADVRSWMTSWRRSGFISS